MSEEDEPIKVTVGDNLTFSENTKTELSRKELNELIAGFYSSNFFQKVVEESGKQGPRLSALKLTFYGIANGLLSLEGAAEPIDIVIRRTEIDDRGNEEIVYTGDSYFETSSKILGNIAKDL